MWKCKSLYTLNVIPYFRKEVITINQWAVITSRVYWDQKWNCFVPEFCLPQICSLLTYLVELEMRNKGPWSIWMANMNKSMVCVCVCVCVCASSVCLHLHVLKKMRRVCCFVRETKHFFCSPDQKINPFSLDGKKNQQTFLREVGELGPWNHVMSLSILPSFVARDWPFPQSHRSHRQELRRVTDRYLQIASCSSLSGDFVLQIACECRQCLFLM